MKLSPFLRDEPFVLTFASGKPATGKSLISVNTAIQCAQANMKAILVDHDLGTASLQTFFNFNKAGDANVAELPENFWLEEGIPNLLIVPGNEFGLDFTSINNAHRLNFFKKIKDINSADIVIIDLVGGAAERNLDIFSMANAGIIVSTTEQKEIIYAYEFLKNAVYRTIYRMFKGQGVLQEVVVAFLKNKHQASTVEQLAKQIAKHNPWAAQKLLEVCNTLDFYLIINQAQSPNDVQIAAKLHVTCQKFLSINLNFVGLLYHDDMIPAHQPKTAPPLSITHPDSITCSSLNKMTYRILQNVFDVALHGRHNESFERQLQTAKKEAEHNFSQMQEHIHAKS